MKLSYVSVAALCAILMLNIVFTQKMVHQYFFQNYGNVIVYCFLNIVLFPIAIYVYKLGQKRKA
jgi:hypothetical protein